MRRKIILLFSVALATFTGLQAQFGIASDISVLRNTNKKYGFFSIGQNVRMEFKHPEYKLIPVFSFGYYATGRYSGTYTGTAKSPATIPATIQFKSNSTMRIQHLTMGGKYYFTGSYNAQDGYSIYGFAGLGIIFTRVGNNFILDTSLYKPPVSPIGETANFNRISADAALGFELPLGADAFVYAEGRVMLPITDYPSRVLEVNTRVPLPVTVSLGIRVYFDDLGF
jgi:hypothetical protein